MAKTEADQKIMAKRKVASRKEKTVMLIMRSAKISGVGVKFDTALSTKSTNLQRYDLDVSLSNIC